MGLAAAYSIINQHDGHIAVESQLGLGTIFKVYLPSSKEEIQEWPQTVGKGMLDRGKILAMDDEEMIRNIIKLMLHQMGYEVELAKDGMEAIGLYQQALEAGEPFDAVILDLTVPGSMGGKEAIARLHEIDANVKAIVTSGYSVDPVMSSYEKYGFCAVVEKPYNLKKLGATLNKVLKR